MADQNQNQITGNIRTLKTDLDVLNSNPQDRLQQAGNFVQARPQLSMPNTEDSKVKPIGSTLSVSATNPNTNTSVEKKDTPLVSNEQKVQPNYSLGNIKPNPIPSNNIASSSILSNTSNTNNPVDKKDIPLTSNEQKAQPNYSWSNMKTNTAPINQTKSLGNTPGLNSQNQLYKENKSGFSVLDESIDLPLDNTSANKTQVPNLMSNSMTSNNISTTSSEINANAQSSKFDINSLNLQDDVKDVKPKSSLAKFVVPGVIVVLLLISIGGGLYFYFNRPNEATNITNNNNNNNTANTIETDNTEPVLTFNSPLTQDSAVDVSFVDSEPIRRTISNILTDKSDTLIQLNLIKDSSPVSLIDISDVFGISIPSVTEVENYRFYAYNQQGVYKLVAVLALSSDKDAKQFVDNWSNSIPRDLSGFSISSPSRIVNTPGIKKSNITNNAGKSFDNYYYNYTSPTDSIDVSSYENYVLLASSQDSMKYILEQIR